jgi:hypothetical protein
MKDNPVIKTESYIFATRMIKACKSLSILIDKHVHSRDLFEYSPTDASRNEKINIKRV